MGEKRKMQRFHLDEGKIWEAIEGLSPYKTTYTLEEVCEKLNELSDDNRQLKKLLQEAEEEINKLKKSNTLLMESLVEKE